MLTTYESDVVMIHKGLSVKVAGCIIEIERDDVTSQAKVVVDTRGRLVLDAVDFEALKFQAGLLKERAQRFFGPTWVVHAWDGKVIVVAQGEASPNRAG